MTVDEMIADILGREGGFANKAEDRGGPTNRGVSLRYMESRGVTRGADLNGDGVVDIADVRLVTDEIAAAWDREDFLEDPGLDALDEALQPQLFDMAVNHGPRRAVIILQDTLRILGMPVSRDGALGPRTLRAAEDALRARGARVLNNELCEVRKSFYRQIVRNDPSQTRFLEGWLNRANEFRS